MYQETNAAAPLVLIDVRLRTRDWLTTVTAVLFKPMIFGSLYPDDIDPT